MACRDAYKIKIKKEIQKAEIVQPQKKEVKSPVTVPDLCFGVNSQVQADDVLQNNLTLFEWVMRNKLYPHFWGRHIMGKNSLTREEIDFLHGLGCKIAAIHSTVNAKETEEQGRLEAKTLIVQARKLAIPQGTAIFLVVDETETIKRNYMKGFAECLTQEGYVAGFKANTDAEFSFDREYSRGMQTDTDVFSTCLIWAVAPGLKEYERVNTTHLVHPDNWKPFAPSGITRKDIAVWQYGKECHPIFDDEDNEITFNVDLVKNNSVIVERMF